MSATERRRGVRWEQHLTSWLRSHGWPLAECAPRGGWQPNGDVLGIPHLYVEAKNTRALDLAGWIDKARTLAGPHRLPLVIVKRRGKADPGDAYVIARLADLAPWLHDPPAGRRRPVGAVSPQPLSNYTRTTAERPCGACDQGWPCRRHDSDPPSNTNAAAGQRHRQGRTSPRLTRPHDRS